MVPCDDRTCDADGCHCTHILDLPYNETIQMVFTNYNPVDTDDLEHHPIHMHGHNFAVLAMGYPTFNSTTGRHIGSNPDVECSNQLCSKASWRDGKTPALNLVNPPVRDVVIVPAGGYVVIRFRATNPGFWAFHCHLEMHMMEGMTMVLRTAVDRIPRLPRNFPTCTLFDWTAEEYEDYQRMPTPSSLPPVDPSQSSNQTLQKSRFFIIVMVTVIVVVIFAMLIMIVIIIVVIIIIIISIIIIIIVIIIIVIISIVRAQLACRELTVPRKNWQYITLLQ